MKTIKMPVSDRVAISRRHNPMRRSRGECLTNIEMEAIILDLYGLKKIGDDPLDLTFEVEDDKKYMMYLLRGLV